MINKFDLPPCTKYAQGWKREPRASKVGPADLPPAMCYSTNTTYEYLSTDRPGVDGSFEVWAGSTHQSICTKQQ